MLQDAQTRQDVIWRRGCLRYHRRNDSGPESRDKLRKENKPIVVTHLSKLPGAFGSTSLSSLTCHKTSTQRAMQGDCDFGQNELLS